MEFGNSSYIEIWIIIPAITEYIIPKVVKLGFKNRYAIMAPIGSLIAQIDV